MSFDSVYRLNSRKVMLHPCTGETVICSADNGSQHPAGHQRDLDLCEECGDVVRVCVQDQRCISCCRCGNYHSMDCDWPL